MAGEKHTASGLISPQLSDFGGHTDPLERRGEPLLAAVPQRVDAGGLADLGALRDLPVQLIKVDSQMTLIYTYGHQFLQPVKVLFCSVACNQGQ